MQDNPYQAPAATIAEATSTDELASRGSRLAAIIIDAIIAMVVFFPIMFATGYWAKAQAGTLGIGTMAGYAAMGFLLFVLIQGYPMAKTAQTWGKRVLGIRMAMLDGSQPTLSTLLLKRYLPIQVVGLVPVLGILAQLVDVFFIFRDDRRCVHDLIAGTRVVKG